MTAEIEAPQVAAALAAPDVRGASALVKTLIIISAGICLVIASGCTEKPTGDAPILVLMNTSMGAFKLELFPEQAPVTVANFIEYVESGLCAARHYAQKAGEPVAIA